MSPDLEKKLGEKFPKIFNTLDLGLECDDGWYNIIDASCSLIQSHINWVNKNKDQDKHIDQVVADQIKEKFGTLRFYCTGGDSWTDGVVSMTEEISKNICEVCGDRGELRDTKWIKTLCDKHYQERVAKQ